jgi:hypothetical protein
VTCIRFIIPYAGRYSGEPWNDRSVGKEKTVMGMSVLAVPLDLIIALVIRIDFYGFVLPVQFLGHFCVL